MSQQEDQGSYRKKLVREIRRKGLEPKSSIPEEGELEEYVYVVGQLINKLRQYGISEELITRLSHVRWDPDKLDKSVSDADAKLIANRDVDETFYRIEQAIRQIDALESQQAPLSPKEAVKARREMDAMQAQDAKRAELVRKWAKRNRTDDGEITR